MNTASVLGFLRQGLGVSVGHWPGLLVCCVIAMASSFVSEHYGGPSLLLALLFGMALNFLSKEPKTKAGIQFCSRSLLRAGVALLGVKISVTQLLDLGYLPPTVVVIGVVFTISVGLILSRIFGLSREIGILTGGAVAICGASAALAIAAALPGSKSLERNTLFAVVAVTTLSTVAMVTYPLLASAIGYDDISAGILFGGTIHDVAQVVGAAAMVSDPALATATYVKLLRVAMLVPVVAIISFMFRREAGDTALARLPGFLIAFCIFAALNSVGAIPTWMAFLLGDVSRAFLLIAIAALGLKTSLQELVEIGWAPSILVILETVLLLGLVVGLIHFG